MSSSRPRTVLIITEEYDPHADKVVDILTGWDECVVRFHTADFPLYSVMNYEYTDGNLDGMIRTSTHTLSLSDVKSAWVRRPTPFRFAPDMHPNDVALAQAETRQAVSGLWSVMDCLWVNAPLANAAAEYKLFALAKAKEVGLSYPATLVTTDPTAVRAFYQKCSGRMIYKPLANPRGPADAPLSAVYANLVDPDSVDLGQIALTPCLFQQYIEKDVELRVNVIGADVFACEIHSQKSANERTRLDWRHYSLSDTPHIAIQLPADIESACRRLVSNLCLQFGAIDLIRQPDGNYVFLEINPSGQFGWIEDLTGLPLYETMARLLARGLH